MAVLDANFDVYNASLKEAAKEAEPVHNSFEMGNVCHAVRFHVAISISIVWVTASNICLCLSTI